LRILRQFAYGNSETVPYNRNSGDARFRSLLTPHPAWTVIRSGGFLIAVGLLPASLGNADSGQKGVHIKLYEISPEEGGNDSSYG